MSKSLIASLLDEAFSCIVCSELMEVPKLLRCGHTLCEECVETLEAQDDKAVYPFSPAVFRCPSCRDVTVMRRDKPLRTNYQLLDAIEYLKKKVESMTFSTVASQTGDAQKARQDPKNPEMLHHHAIANLEALTLDCFPVSEDCINFAISQRGSQTVLFLREFRDLSYSSSPGGAFTADQLMHVFCNYCPIGASIGNRLRNGGISAIIWFADPRWAASALAHALERNRRGYWVTINRVAVHVQRSLRHL